MSLSRVAPVQVADGSYRRGAVMGMTMAEAIILVTFTLLLLLALWKVQDDQRQELYRVVEGMEPSELLAAAQLKQSGQLETVAALVAGGADFRSSEITPETAKAWRQIEDESLRDAVDRVEALPPEMRQDIIEVIEAATTPEDLEAVRKLLDEGQAKGAAELVAEGVDFQSPDTRDLWRLIDQDELQRILRSANDLPPDLQSDLADLVEIQDPELLERVLRLAERAQVQELAEMSEEELQAAIMLADLDQIMAVQQLVADGADFREPETTPATRDEWRLIEDEQARELLDAAQDLPDTTQGELAQLIASAGREGLEALIQEAQRADEDRGLEERLAGIGRRIAEADDQTRNLVEDLREELGDIVAKIHGTIEADGSIVLPDTVLFEQGSAQISPVLQSFLDQACEPWLNRLMIANAPVAYALIEGHASKEWRNETSPDEAYLNNLALSQSRSQAVLDACLRIVGNNQIRDWAHTHLAAVGYSSAKPVITDGVEDPDRSRRVVFSIGIDDRQLLDEVAHDANLASLAPEANDAR